MIPTSTGAAKAIYLVIPELKGKLDGFAVRVPTPNVSAVDLVCEVGRNVTVEEVNAALKAASQTAPLKGYLNYEEEELVSSDFKGDPASSTLDAKLIASSAEIWSRPLPGMTTSGATATASKI